MPSRSRIKLRITLRITPKIKSQTGMSVPQLLASYQVEEGLMDAGVGGEFGVEGGGHGSSLGDGDGVVPFCREHFYFVSDAFDLGRADEDHFERRVSGLLFRRSV